MSQFLGAPQGVCCRGAVLRQARVTVNKQRVSRATCVSAVNRLVLTPTGSGSCDHIGDKLPLPAPIPLKEGVWEVGRSEPADILLPIPTVSNRHALLRVEADKVSITDLNSTNGTIVNGEELTPMDNMEVAVGGEVVFGDVHLAKFQLELQPDEAESP